MCTNTNVLGMFLSSLSALFVLLAESRFFVLKKAFPTICFFMLLWKGLGSSPATPLRLTDRCEGFTVTEVLFRCWRLVRDGCAVCRSVSATSFAKY